MISKSYYIYIFLILFLYSCATIKQPSIIKIDNNTNQISKSLESSSKVLKRKVAIARFTNESNYGKSVLSDS